MIKYGCAALNKSRRYELLIIYKLLGLPSVTTARKVIIEGTQIVVEQVLPDGYTILVVPMPALVTVSSEIGELRSASLPSIMAAKKKEVTIWDASSLGVKIERLKRMRLINLFQPVHEGKCVFIDGQTAEEKGANLAGELRNIKLI